MSAWWAHEMEVARVGRECAEKSLAEAITRERDMQDRYVKAIHQQTSLSAS